MIEKMNFVTITGPKDEIDRIAEEYLSKYEVQLEYAPVELKSTNTLYPYLEQNPYKDSLNLAEELKEIIGKPDYADTNISPEDAVGIIENLYERVKESNGLIENCRDELAACNEKLSSVLPFEKVNYNINEILNFKNLKYRFGKIPKEYYEKFSYYVEKDINSVFVKAREDESYVWGVYFVPVKDKEIVDAEYTALRFERTFVPDVPGTPEQAIESIRENIRDCEGRIEAEEKKLTSLVEEEKDSYAKAYNALKKHSFNFDVRKYAACTKEEGLSYFILCGWMSEKDSRRIEKDIAEKESDTLCLVDGKSEATYSKPPTKLKNPKIVRPFEMFIRMYGVPSYNEIDPTIFVAITYAFIFGAMFGDVGQGLCLLAGGIILYKVKKMELAAIVAQAGFFSTIFGFLYGSVFGFEDVIHHLWLSPKSEMINLPFVGSLNTVFVVAVAFGMGLEILAMVFHVINAFKAKDTENKWFDANGVAGLVFYASLVCVIVLFMTGNKLPAGIVMAVMFIVPLILIALKELLTHMIQKKKAIEGGVGMFATQTFFEMFEVLLSYFSNTLSFIRIGAFAVSHAAMMEVVLMLAGAENGGTGNIVVIVLGNIVVCGLEGLIVGIQVLRLEYYELFSRFYKGTGREFKPYGKTR